MAMGRTFGLALAGCGLLASMPTVAFAGDDDATLKDRIRQLEEQVAELRGALVERGAGESRPLAEQLDRYLQEQEKGAFWRDRNGNPLQKSVNSMWVTGYLRTRPEYWDNFAYASNTTDDSGVQTFTRARLGIGANLARNASLYLELNMPGSWGDSFTTYANDGGSMVTPNVHQAYVKGLLADTLGMGTQVGRFEMSYGDEFVIGDRDFFQPGLYFDGARFSKSWDEGKSNVDILYGKLVEGFKGTGVDDNVYLLGAYATMAAQKLDVYYLLVKNNNDMTGLPTGGGTIRDVHTLGVRSWGGPETDAGFGWNVNANGQFSRDLSYAFDGTAWFRMSADGWKPRLWGQLAYAHGDKDAGDTSYNPLFQDAHGRYGYSDLWFFSNLALGGIGFEISPQENLTYGISGRSYHLARVPAGSPAGKSDRLAWEYDFYVHHKWSENVAIEAVYAFVKWRSSNTTGADDVQRAYVNVVVSF